jgi:hypothetical protein
MKFLLAPFGVILLLWTAPASAQAPAPSWDGTCSIFSVTEDSTNGYTQAWMDYGCTGSFTNGTMNGTVKAELWVEIYYDKVTGYSGTVTQTSTWPNIPSSSQVHLAGNFTPDRCWRAVGRVTWEVGPRYQRCYFTGSRFVCNWYDNVQTVTLRSPLHCP